MNEAQKLVQLARKAGRSAQAMMIPGLSALLEALADYVESKEGRQDGAH